MDDVENTYVDASVEHGGVQCAIHTCVHVSTSQRYDMQQNLFSGKKSCPRWIRTHDTRLERQLLYQLSYLGNPAGRKQTSNLCGMALHSI
jgi:hypothetical protein